ncbi:ADP-ribose pyrophosphatase [Thermus composti]|uniref:NUDIX domain-containing protein n=1 Tax=Thermus composti TaxID=532059 RepID=A0ABV6PZU9_9DEIN|nr:NUDIX hydrolase [Thermus composti]GGN06229.1 ADP-ribose pyrophosphatase [Thermus composti]
MSPWERLALEEILSEPVRLVRERLRTHTGKELTYIYRPGPVAASFVLPVTGKRTALLIRQYRHPTGKFLLEVPAGKVDPGETPEGAARRELLEEVGARAEEVIPLPPFHPQPSFTAVVFHPFLALGAEVVAEPRLEDGELLETLELPLREVYALLEAGEIQDAATALTLFYARPHLLDRGLL